MVVVKSKSHPDLLLFSSPRLFHRRTDSDTDSLSSLEFTSTPKEEESVPSGIDHYDPRTVGQALWKLLLNNELPRDASSTDFPICWEALKAEHAEFEKVTSGTLQRYYESLASIVILDDETDPRTQEFLQKHNAKLVTVGEKLTAELYEQSPHTYHAYVADFNDNLAYAMKTTRGFPTQNPAVTMTDDEWNAELDHFTQQLQSILHSPELEIQTSFLKTEHQTIPQPAHVDFAWQVLEERAEEMWLAFFGLTQEGMILQVWPDVQTSADKACCYGTLVYVPLGKLLLAPSDIIHGGGFRTAPMFVPAHTGNIRYHLYVATHGTSLPAFATNVYTLKDDKRHELSEVCLDAPGLVGSDHSNGNGLLMELLLE